MSCATPLKSITLLKPLVPFFFFFYLLFSSRSGPFIQLLIAIQKYERT